MRQLFLTFILIVALVAPVYGQGQKSMRVHECLTAQTIVSGASANGSDVVPLGSATELAGFVTFTSAGGGKLTVTIQTRRAGSSTWHTPSIGAEPLTAVAAGSHHFPISVPPCEALRLVYTASVADISVVSAHAIDQN